MQAEGKIFILQEQKAALSALWKKKKELYNISTTAHFLSFVLND
jgi:hypothetical protein